MSMTIMNPLRPLALTDLRPDDVAEGSWLAGLVDGEGCFHLRTTRVRTVRGYHRRYRVLTFAFVIALRADDRATLERARTLLGVGHIGQNRRGHGPATSSNAKPLAALVVQARNDLARIVGVFRTYPLRSKKARDFDLWAAAHGRFEDVLKSTPLSAVRQGALSRASASGRRPLHGTTRQRFRTIPDDLFAEMTRYADAITKVREYA